MTRGPRHHFDPVTAERLLTGTQDDYAAADQRVHRLLAAAAAPGRVTEVTGKEDALRAFRHALHAPGTRRRLTRAIGRIGAVKLVALAVGAASVGGVALAATTGSLPAPAQDVAHDAFGAPPAHTGERPSTAPTNQPNATPSPSLPGLCVAYFAQPVQDRGKALQSPAFTVLVTAAGGPEKVEDFCTDLTPAQPGSTPSHPQGGPPTAVPTPNHPTGPPREPGRPSSVPTRR